MTLACRRDSAAAAFTLACIAIFYATPAPGQASRRLDIGSRVRVRVEGSSYPLVGVITELRPDTLLLALPSLRVDRLRLLPVSDIAELNISGGHRRYTALGVAIGVLTGVAVTVAYNGIIQSQCFDSCPDPVSLPVGAAVGGIAVGSALYFVRVERWLPVALPNRRRQ
jgi:hypothetical protein